MCVCVCVCVCVFVCVCGCLDEPWSQMEAWRQNHCHRDPGLYASKTQTSKWRRKQNIDAWLIDMKHLYHPTSNLKFLTRFRFSGFDKGLCHASTCPFRFINVGKTVEVFDYSVWFWEVQEPNQILHLICAPLALTCACVPDQRRPSHCKTDHSAPGNGGSTCGETDAMNDKAFYWPHNQLLNIFWVCYSLENALFLTHMPLPYSRLY